MKVAQMDEQPQTVLPDKRCSVDSDRKAASHSSQVPIKGRKTLTKKVLAPNLFTPLTQKEKDYLTQLFPTLTALEAQLDQEITPGIPSDSYICKQILVPSAPSGLLQRRGLCLALLL